MKFGLSFNASELTDFPEEHIPEVEAIEAYTHDRNALSNDRWPTVWKNVERAAAIFGAENTCFHFPVLNSSFIKDQFVRDRLHESLQRASDIGIRGVAVCSNEIHNSTYWRGKNLNAIRTRVLETLGEIRIRHCSPTWLGLENLPTRFSFGLAPLFCYPRDFKSLEAFGIGIVWDFGNFAKTLVVQSLLTDTEQEECVFDTSPRGHFFDFTALKKNISHWHFSAVSDSLYSSSSGNLTDKVIPPEGLLPESIYREALQIISHMEIDAPIIFEVAECNIKERTNARRIITWANEALGRSGYQPLRPHTFNESIPQTPGGSPLYRRIRVIPRERAASIVKSQRAPLNASAALRGDTH